MAMPEEFVELALKVNNWGRWGPSDERGTVNLITDDVVKAAAAAIRHGKRFCLGIPLSTDGPQIGIMPGRVNPLRTMVEINSPYGDSAFRSSDDVVVMGLQAATHWDSLAHVSYENRLYNGFAADTITVAGAAHCGIDKIGPLVGRGVLLDITRVHGVDKVEGGHALTPDDLDAAEELGKVTVRSGDIVLVRTGQMATLKAGDKMGYVFPCAGPSMQSVQWFRDRDVAAVATDNLTFEVFPGEREDLPLPVHLLHLVEMGMTQGQNFDLDELAADCADDGVYEFFLDATPQPFVAGVGTPVNPVAIK
jgi:kynurenine formamidase